MLIQQFNIISTLYLSKWINTGDKVLDNSLVTLFAIILSAFLFHIVERWRDYYNLIIFYLYGMYNNPLALLNVPYNMECIFENYAEFHYKTRDTQLYILIQDINAKLKDYKIVLTLEDVKKCISLYAESNNLPKVLDKQGRPLSIQHYNNNIYPIAVSRYGNLVYIETHYGELRSRGIGYRDTIYIREYLIKYIVESAIKNNIIMSSDDIYVPTYVKKEINRALTIELEMKSIGKINKKKTFDTLYYPQKSELVALISRFRSGMMYPSHIPIDNKLGILLYGPPGTGKTGTISAVANMLQRSIIMINFANITTCNQLDMIMDPTNYTKFIYVFDEFDCILDVINDTRGDKKDTSKQMDWGNMLLLADEAERKNILAMMRDEHARTDDTLINMAYLLQKLDGLESAEGRVIIATTNNPDKINPALLRPGRFDIKICLEPATEDMVVDILTNFFQGDDEMRKIIAEAKIPGGVFTPLDLINAAIQTPDYKQLLVKLSN